MNNGMHKYTHENKMAPNRLLKIDKLYIYTYIAISYI